MADIDFIDSYVPATEELSTVEVQDMRDRIVQFTNDAFPDIASAPGTVLGDLIVTPQSYIMAAMEKGLDRVLSDLCLENVANGVVYNCDFVQKYIKNFCVDQSEYYPSSGIVRLVFTEDKTYVLDRSTQFKIEGQIYTIYLPNSGPFTCYSSVELMMEGKNGSRLKYADDDRWFCDVPVIGNVGEVSIPASTDVSLSVFIPELVAADTLIPFSNGVQLNTIENLAKKAQTTMYSASLNTRNGAVQYVKSVCPFVESVFAVKNGDREMLRDWRNPYGISQGCLDLYARSQSYEFTEQQVIRLVLQDTPDENGDTWFEGYWDYVGQPYHLESITHENVELRQLPYKILSSNDRDLGAVAAYTQSERLYVKVKNLLSNGDSIYDTFISEGETYAYFIVTYQTDPMLPAISQTLENEDYAPINASIMVRGFIPVIIDELTVRYVKKHGVVPNLEEAADQIKIYLGKVGAPNSYTDAEISRIMGEAGVAYTKEIKVQAHVQWSVADMVLKYGETVDISDPGNEDIMQPVPASPVIRDSDGLRITYPNHGVAITADMMYSCSPRNIRYFLMENALKFEEVVDV